MNQTKNIIATMDELTLLNAKNAIHGINNKSASIFPYTITQFVLLATVKPKMYTVNPINRRKTSHPPKSDQI